jgi:hypothetical protein
MYEEFYEKTSAKVEKMFYSKGLRMIIRKN